MFTPSTLRSILDGAIRIDELCQKAVEYGQKSVAITDHGSLGGFLQLYKTAQEYNLKPIIGIEAYLTEDEDGLTKTEMTRDNYHLVLLAKNNEGLKNLFRLSSNAWLTNFYHKPRISYTHLAKYSEGLIALSGCINSQCFRYGCWDPETSEFSDPDGKALEILKYYKDIFGKDLYLEIQDNPDLPQQDAYNRFLIDQVSPKLDLQPIITADAHYLTQDSKELHDVLMAIQTKKSLEEYQSPDNEFQFGPWNYLRSSEEMLQAARKHRAPQAFESTLEVAEKCSIEVELGKYKPPVFPIEEEGDYKEFQKWLENNGTVS